MDRLKRAIAIGKAQVSAFRWFGRDSSSDAGSADDLRAIVLSLARQENGYGIATDILSMQFHSDRNQEREYPFEIIDAGRTLLSSPVFNHRDNMDDYRLRTIANVCLRGAEGSPAARSLCERIKQGFTDSTFSFYRYEKLLQCIFRLQPRIALDSFFGGDSQTHGSDLDLDNFDDPSDHQKNPLDGVPIEEMLRWCDEKPAERYPAIAQAVSYHIATSDTGPDWTPLAIEMLKRSPDPPAVLEAFLRRFSPTSWSGSRAAIIESRLGLLDRLDELKITSLADCVTRIRPQLVDDIARTRKWENQSDSARDERFE